jgi:serine/threonine-protein kinase
LENLWRQGQSPDVREYLGRLANLSPAQVVAVLCVDQGQRWHHGDRVPAETYLKMHPALAAAWADAFELVYAEFRLRQELGEEPDLPEFLHRFPQYAAKLQRLDPSTEYSSVPYTANINTPGDVISTAGDVILDPRVTSEWPSVPGYKVLGKLGQGGMGHVFKARQERLDRLVALKIIRKENISQDPAAIHRFQREAQTAAQLSHPNIIVIFDFNQYGDTYYIAMEYVEGVDLHNFVQDFGPLRPEMAADYTRQVALGLQHAFERGMVHRDIKPSNLMVALPKMEAPSPNGRSASPPGPPDLNQLQKGIVKILDLGTALITHTADSESAQWTKQGTLMGTPDYLAPEQAVDSHSVDIRADLYSVGCTFFYLLTGKPPFGEYPLMKKLMMHQTGEPPPIRDLQPDVPASMEAVVRRLLAKRPDDRYQTPGELVEALSPQPVPKNPSGLQALPTLEIRRPVAAPVTTTADLAPTPSSIKITAPPSGSNLKWTGKAKAERPAASEDDAKTIAILQGHTSWVVALAFSPDRNLLASAAVQGNVRLWDFSGKKPGERSSFQAALNELHSLVYAPDKSLLASGSGSLDGTVWLWDMMQPMPRVKLTLEGHDAPVDALAFSADCKLLATGSCDKTIRVWDLSDELPVERAVFKGHADHVKAVAFLPDGKTLVSGGLDGTVRLWRKGGFWSRDQVALLQGRWGAVQSVAVSADGKALAFGCLDQTVRLWSLAGDEPHEAAVLQGHSGVIRMVLFPPDGKTLASICDGGRIILWDTSTAAKLREWQLPQANRCSYTFTFDARYVATGLSDGVVQVFRLYPKKSHHS